MCRTVPLSTIRSFSLYTQQWYMSYRFANSLRAGSGRSSILILLASCQQTCITYTRTEFHSDPVRKLSANLYDIYQDGVPFWSCSQAVSKPVWHIPGRSSILILLASCQQTWMTYTRTEFHSDPARKLSANLYDIYHCCMYSEKLLMMDRGTVRNMYSFIPKINLKN